MTYVAAYLAISGSFLLGWVLRVFMHEREIDKHFWDGYKRGAADERYRQAEETRPIASRLADGPLIYGVLMDELMMHDAQNETEAQRLRRIGNTLYNRWKPE